MKQRRKQICLIIQASRGGGRTAAKSRWSALGLTIITKPQSWMWQQS